MRLGLLLTFVAFPLLELALLIKAGQIIGVGPTLAIVVATAILGLLILRWQGFTVVRRTRLAIREGRAPVEPVVNSALVFAAGAFLISPGLIADTIGLLLLIPWARRFIARWGLRECWGGATIKVFRTGQGPGPRDGERPRRSGPIIEGDYQRVEETRKDKTPDRDRRNGER
jgi:UPF0716 protein FxsA